MDRIRVTDFNTANTLTTKMIVGKSFAFLASDTFDAPGFTWLRKLFGHSANQKPHIISLLGTGAIQLPGIEIDATKIEAVQLRSVTCDKSIYRADRDFVNLLVLSPLHPNSTQTVEIRANGSTFSRHQLTAGRYGECQLTLKDLPTGDYEAVFSGEQNATCEFSVAEYKLVPLVVSLVEKKVDKDSNLKVTLNLESFGTPVNGDVRIDVLDRGARQLSLESSARDGRCSVSFALKGEGPHALGIQLTLDPSKTASVPLTGSRAAERSFTVFSPLGNEVVGSLLPSEHAREVRGIYLEEGGTRTSPISLDRVDATKATLRVHSALDALRVVLMDPAGRAIAGGAVDPASAAHPSNSDPQYRQGESLFQQGRHSQALETFKTAYDSLQGQRHPFYSYFIACCYSSLNQREQALEWLKVSVQEGWSDFAHMSADSDLKALQGWQPFSDLLGQGYKELTFDHVAANEVLEVEVFAPYTVMALGAYVNGKPWEGWASVVTPGAAPPQVVTPEKCEPESDVVIEVTTTSPAASVYAIVKDARLLSPDSPKNRLAAAIKAQVEKAGEKLQTAYPTEEIRDHLNVYDRRQAPGTAWGGGNTGQHQVYGRALFSRMDRSREEGSSWGGMEPDYEAAPKAMAAAAPLAASRRLSLSLNEGTIPKPESAPPRQVKTAGREPEVLFAGFIPVEGNSAKLQVKLPEAITEYLVECFQISGTDWSTAESRFRAEKDPFVDLNVPVFARQGEAACGTVSVGSSQAVKLKVFRDGQPVQLTADGHSLSADEVSGLVSFKFAAGPGTYKAILETADGARAGHRTKEVNEPGKLKRRVRSLRLLEQGQSVSLENNQQLLSLAVLPGLDSSFKLLAQATADYGHACCEQTGAKILSNCLLYLSAPDAESKRKAEAAIIAGVRREQSMWLRGRGFKMYPESPNTPHDYYTPKVAKYLYYISSLVKGETADLRKAIQDSRDMAVDATTACKMQWPPTSVGSCEDAYTALRFSNNGVTREALNFVRNQAAESAVEFCKRLPNNPYLGQRVFQRTELAYAAATLLRSGESSALSKAIELAGPVIESFNESGMLYSTVDSIPALVLMSELQNAKITEGTGKLEVDGVECTLEEALAKAGSISSVKVLEGVVTVEECKQVVEDWTTLSSDLQIRVALEKGGRPQRSFMIGDYIELVVTLESGYTDGDLLWVCLPDALSRVSGGGQIKLFSVDFRGKAELRVPLAVTGTTQQPSGEPGQQTFAVCVRNMFNEERGASAGLQQIAVSEMR